MGLDANIGKELGQARNLAADKRPEITSVTPAGLLWKGTRSISMPVSRANSSPMIMLDVLPAAKVSALGLALP